MDFLLVGILGIGLTNLCQGGVNSNCTWYFHNLSVGLYNLLKSHMARNL